MINRDYKGRMVFQSLDFRILIGDLFEKCKTVNEVEWLTEQLTSAIECASEERTEEIEEEE